MDVDLRKLRYFVAVAQNEHFGRASQSLFVTQPVLSRQIQSLEKALGCDLLERTTRRVQLTDAGRQLLADAPSLLASFDAAVHRVRAADRGSERLAVAFAPGLQVSVAVRAFAAKYPDVVLDLFQVNWWDQAAPLRDGRADVGYLRRPFDDKGLHVVPIASERLAAVVPVNHRLARRRKLRATDFDGEKVLNSDNRNECIAEEKAELIAAGDCLAVLPMMAAKLVERPGLKTIPVVDAEPFATCLAVLKGHRNKNLQDSFLQIGKDVLVRKS